MDTEAATAGHTEVLGTLRASRTAPSRLTLCGNLVVRGVLDYGRPQDRVVVPATIRFVLDERLYVGGNTAVPLATDVGLWAMGDGQVWMHGQYRDAWSPLTQTSAAGSSQVCVQDAYAQGWQVGDLLMLTPTGPPATQGRIPQIERRVIAAVLGGGCYRITQALQFAHAVTQTAWMDPWGDAWTEVMAGKVANLTSNLRLEAADPNHRPHVLFMDRAKAYVEDVAVVGFGPAPKFVGTVTIHNDEKLLPMGRYAWHFHIQDAGSRGSYLRRVRLYDGVGNGLNLHESWGIEATDLVVANQARYRARINGWVVAAAGPIMFEASVVPRYATPKACEDCVLDRPLVIGWGLPDDPYFSHGIWITNAVRSSVSGAVVAGGVGSSLSSGIHWVEGGGGDGEEAHVYRSEVFSTRAGLHSWQNVIKVPPDRIVDVLVWKNGVGVAWGAYVTGYWGHQVRSIGNLSAQLLHWAANWGITGFLADGFDAPASVGIQVGRYASASTQDSVYEDGVVRNVRKNLESEGGTDMGRTQWVQFTRIAWHPGAGLTMTSGVIPNGSRWRLRQQTGLNVCLTTTLACPLNFTLYRIDELGVGGVADTNLNAIRVDGDTAGTRAQPPRVRLLNPDESFATGAVVLVAESDAAEVIFWNAHRFLGRAPVSGGRATLTVTLGPERRAYVWADASSNGVTNTSRVIRLRRF